MFELHLPEIRRSIVIVSVFKEKVELYTVLNVVQALKYTLKCKGDNMLRKKLLKKLPVGLLAMATMSAVPTFTSF